MFAYIKKVVHKRSLPMMGFSKKNADMDGVKYDPEWDGPVRWRGSRQRQKTKRFWLAAPAQHYLHNRISFDQEGGCDLTHRNSLPQYSVPIINWVKSVGNGSPYSSCAA